MQTRGVVWERSDSRSPRIAACWAGAGKMPALPAVVAFLIGIALVFAACAPAGAPSRPAAEPGAASSARTAERTLAVAVRVEPHSIAPKPLGGGGVKVKTSVRFFNAALELVDDRGVAQPYLADALPQLHTDTWEVFPDGRMETRYRLKPNLTWHDGARFSAEDYVFAWRVYATPELGVAGIPPLNVIEEVAAPDERTIIMRWRRPYPQAAVLQDGGTISRFPALPRHILQAPYQEGQWDSFGNHAYWTREFIGMGPYRLEQWRSGEFIEGSAFDGHVMGRPKIDRLRIAFIGDANTGLANLLSGTIHFAADDGLDLEQGVTAKREFAASGGQRGGVLLITTDVWRAVHAQFRPEYVNPRALLDVRVRRALAHALDKDALNGALFDGEGVMADTVLPPSFDYYPVVERAVTKYAYDVRRSGQAMNEAGFARDGEGFFVHPTEGRFSPELKTNASRQNESERSIIAAGWRQAGFDVQEATVPVAQAQDIQVRSTYRSLYNYGRGLGENNLPNFHSANVAGQENRWTGANRGGWAHPDYNRLVDTLGATLDREERVRLLAQIARTMSDELPMFPLYYDLGAVVHTGALRGPGPVSPETTGLVSWNISQWELR